MNASKFDVIWARVREVVAFIGGMVIMFFEAFKDKSDRPWLYAAAIGMMGLPVARYIETTLGKYTSGGPQLEPPQAQPPNQSPTEPPSGGTTI